MLRAQSVLEPGESKVVCSENQTTIDQSSRKSCHFSRRASHLLIMGELCAEAQHGPPGAAVADRFAQLVQERHDA